ncbi:MAG: preprotein translocase subunit YajC [Alphaproteobacteria bacterium]
MLISPAYAQGAAPTAGFDPSFFMPLILIFVVFYFLLIRPQQKKLKEHKALVAALRRGDKVVTQGGLIGTISRVVSDTEVLVDVGEGVRVRMLRGAVSEVLSKTEPAGAEKESQGAESAEGEGGKKGRRAGKDAGKDTG